MRGAPLRLVRTFALLLLAGLLLAAGWLLWGQQPLVPASVPLTQAERDWVRGWLRDVRPSNLKDGERATLALTESEANLLARYLAGLLGDGRVALRLRDGRAHARISVGLPWDPTARFVNLELSLVEHAARPGDLPDATPEAAVQAPPEAPSAGPVAGPGDASPQDPAARSADRRGGLPRVENARLSGLPLPNGLVQTLANRLLAALDRTRVLQGVEIDPGRIRIAYQWHTGAAERIAGGLVAPQDLKRILHYQDLLIAHADGLPSGRSLRLADLLSRTLAEAERRSRRGFGLGDPVAENRAALLALAAYANWRRIRDPDDATPPTQHRWRRVLLAGRQDLGRHFTLSAALATQGGSVLADLAGLAKEISDSQGGSGFSFPDLAADRAGTRFARLATGERSGARGVQAFARRGFKEDDFMPPIAGLPEGMTQAELKATYRAVVDRIERHIDARSLFRAASG